MIVPGISDKQHFFPPDTADPFAVGILDSSRDYVHVVDDFSLDVLLQTLDTITDFVRYLEHKANFVQSGRLKFSAGEEELLAYYLKHADQQGNHCFEFPKHVDAVILNEGSWENFQRHPDRLAQIECDRISYAWDALIEEFSKHILAETQYFTTDSSAGESETALRFMAAECRTRRRMLAKSIYAVIERADTQNRAARVLAPSYPGDPYYIFLALKPAPGMEYAEYREARRNLLQAYCLVTRLIHREAIDIVGIATEPASTGSNRSEDLIYVDASEWDESLDAEARQLQNELGILRMTKEFRSIEPEYPRERDKQMYKGRSRNCPCPCGSGMKFKRCCGSRRPDT